MKIYVAGPYTAPTSEQIEENIKKAETLALGLVKQGHTPFVPHTMMRHWEEGGKVERPDVMRICNEWIGQCDALFYLGSSSGADAEKAVAQALNLHIYDNENPPPPGRVREEVEGSVNLKDLYLAEYSQCATSYGHTYQTMWSAGGVFFAVSGGILALQGKSGSGISFAVLWAGALLPIWFWYLAIFRPMDRYGEKRRGRLKQIEITLNGLFPPLQMKHFSDDDISGQGSELVRNKRWWNSLASFVVRFIIRPRVNWYVNAVGLAVSLYEVVFLVCSILKRVGLKWTFLSWVG